MNTKARIDAVLAQQEDMGRKAAAALDALADGRGDLEQYTALCAQQAALADVQKVLRKRAHAQRLEELTAAERQASEAWAAAHDKAALARKAAGDAIAAMRVFMNRRRDAAPDAMAERGKLEHAIAETKMDALMAAYDEELAGRALQEARAAREAEQDSGE